MSKDHRIAGAHENSKPCNQESGRLHLKENPKIRDGRGHLVFSSDFTYADLHISSCIHTPIYKYIYIWIYMDIYGKEEGGREVRGRNPE